MNFEFTADQRALLDAVDRIAAHHEVPQALGTTAFVPAPGLEADLEGAALLDAAAVEELGAVAAVAMVIRLARLPQGMELIARTLLGPLHWPPNAPALIRWPCAVLWEGRGRAARFLPGARTVLCVRGTVVEAAPVQAGDVLPLDSPFGYPVGRLRAPDALPWQPVHSDAQALRTTWRVGLAAELAGQLGAALDAVVQHVRDRRQFGRPLGSFQAVQHRLAEAAVRVEAMRCLALQAAHRGTSADAAAAAGYAQQAAAPLIYDLHQFMGAMGLTLEHPLHRWTTRAKMLRADLGGHAAQYQALADATWGTAGGIAA